MSLLDRIRRASLLALLFGGFLATPTLRAQALCSLRDPKRQIASLYPTADGYRSIVRVVSNAAREALKERLPFTLHFNELGRHTLYVVQEKGRPLGLVHVRSEAGKWGLVEIAWALDFDLTITGYEFQRCRDRSKNSVLADSTQLRGMGFEELLTSVNSDGSQLRNGQTVIPRGGESLGLTLVRNALKTIAVTQAAWGEDLVALQAESFARQAIKNVASLSTLDGLYGPASASAITDHVGPEGTGISRSKARAFLCRTEKGNAIGRVVLTPWTYDDRSVNVRWAFSMDGRILGVDGGGGWPSEEVAQAFQALVGQRPAASNECSGYAGLVATEVAIAQSLAREPRGQ